MVRSPAIAKKEWGRVAKKYRSGLPMQKVADIYGVSIDAVTYILRRLSVPRRSFREASRLSFEAKKPSFIIRSRQENSRTMNLAGAMLYWAEGYKRDTASGIDFANSDPDMILIFWNFLKNRYLLDMKRLYFSVYYYEDQDLQSILKFWRSKLAVPASQFRHPYMKRNPSPTARKLPYGVLHIRYTDKKLLRDVLSLIQSFKEEICVGGGVVKRN